MINIFVAVVGLIFGSFIAAYSYRYPRGIKISKGLSFCDNCKRKIEWYENIPVVSYLFLDGKCKTCKKKISIRYPLIEMVSGLAFLIIFLTRGSSSYNFIFLFVIYFIMMMIFVIDFENQIIPDDFVFAGIAFVFLYELLFSPGDLYSSLASGFIASFFLLLIHLFTKGKGMGLGDVKFAVFGGMLVGITNLFPWMLGAFLTGAIVGIILILIGNAKLKDKIAFGPFLVISIPLAMVWGQKLMDMIL